MEAHDVAQVMGASAALHGVVSTTWWVVTDTGGDYFGESVDEAVIKEACEYPRRRCCGHPQCAWAMDCGGKVLRSDLDASKNEKGDGAGKDPRIGGSHCDTRGQEFATTRQALADQSEVDASADFPLDGLRAVSELLGKVTWTG